MKAPKCRLCGSEHWGLCPESRARAAALADAKSAEKKSKVAEPAAAGRTGPAVGATGNARRAAPATGKHPVGAASTTPKPKVGRPRIEDVDKTIAAQKPWIKEGMSRASWYRRRAAKK